MPALLSVRQTLAPTPIRRRNAHFLGAIPTHEANPRAGRTATEPVSATAAARLGEPGRACVRWYSTGTTRAVRCNEIVQCMNAKEVRFCGVTPTRERHMRLTAAFLRSERHRDTAWYGLGQSCIRSAFRRGCNLTRRSDRLSSLLDQRRQAALSLGTQHRCPQGRQRDTRLWCESSRE